MEVALCVHENKITKFKGDILCGITIKQIRRKWVEICGSICSPKWRDKYNLGSIQDIIVFAWKKEWFDIFKEMEKGLISPQVAWDYISLNLPNLGKDPLGSIPITDTWRWTIKERKRFCLLKLDSEDETLHEKVNIGTEEEPIIRHKAKIDYENNTSLGFLPSQILVINNPDIIVHPKLNINFPVSIVEFPYGR